MPQPQAPNSRAESRSAQVVVRFERVLDVQLEFVYGFAHKVAVSAGWALRLARGGRVRAPPTPSPPMSWW